MHRGRSLWIILALIAAAAIGLVGYDLAVGSPAPLQDRLGQGAYLGILALVIAGGMFGSTRRVGDTLRSLALWAVILLALVAGYQYRYELQDFASRVSAGLVPGSPVSVTNAEGETTVMLEKLSSGHFEAQALVNGRAVDMMLDTGATTTVLTARDAAAAGFDLAGLNYQVPVSTANGMAMAARIVLDEIGIGKITRSNMPALVAAEGMLEQSLLGMNFLGTLSGYDVRGDRMILRD
jgi:aspartyl protease family protein